MKVLVTGGLGFIGSHLVKSLTNQNHTVIVFDNLKTGQIDNLNKDIEKITFVQGDLRNYDLLKKVLNDVDWVFHEGALASVPESFRMPEEYYDVNVKGTENIFKLGKEFQFKIVFASSSSVYGNPIKLPIKEDHPKNPINPYGKTKLDCELLAEKYVKEDVEIIGLRYFNVYGERQSETYAGVILKFLENIHHQKPLVIFGDGLQFRDFVYVGDVVRANILAMENKIREGFFNIGTGKVLSVLDLANIMIKLAHQTLKPIHKDAIEGDIKGSQAEITLAKRLLNWESQTKIENWLKETISK